VSIKLAFAVAAVAALTGCTTAAQRQYQAMVTGNQTIAEQGKACIAAVYNAPEGAPLRAHVPLDPRDASLTQLSDPAHASQVEAAAVEHLHPRLRACQRAVLDGLNSTTPGAVPILTKESSASDDDTLLLVQGKLSWGEYTRRQRDLVVATQEALTLEGRRIVAGLEQQHEAEMERRAAASAALLNAAAAYSEMAQPSRLPYGAYTLPSNQITCTHNEPFTTCNW
jgi:hypothetical protein